MIINYLYDRHGSRSDKNEIRDNWRTGWMPHWYAAIRLKDAPAVRTCAYASSLAQTEEVVVENTENVIMLFVSSYTSYTYKYA